jgi:hypothetical protein
MSFFFFKRNTVVLDCFTDNQALRDLYYIDYGNKFYPSWWKQLPKEYVSKKSILQTKVTTMKGCIGLIEYFKNSIAVPLWSDYQIRIGSLTAPSIMFQPAGPWGATHHEHEQWGSYLPPTKYGHLKLDAPWRLRTKDLVQFAFSNPFYTNYSPQDYLFCPGILDFKYQNSVNVNMMFDYREDIRTVLLKAGDPIAMLIPLTDKEVKIKLHLVDKKELDNINVPPLTFNGHYKFTKNLVDNQEKAKCPLGFGRR